MSAVAAIAAWLRRTPAVPAAAFLSALLCIFLPAQAYQANQPYMLVPFLQAAMVLLPAALVSFAVLVLLASRGELRTRRIAAAALYGLGFAAWISGSFLTQSKGVLDGKTVLEFAGGREAVLNGLLYVGLALAAGMAAYRHGDVARRLAGALFVVLLGHALWVGASDSKPWRHAIADGKVASLSTQRNVMVILLDAFQSDFFAEISKADPGLAMQFDGFTFFENAVGHSATTYLALPAIHSGSYYQEGDSLRSAYRTQVANESFMAKLADAGYDAMLVNPIFECPSKVECASALQVLAGADDEVRGAAATLVGYSLFRAAPEGLKPYVYRDGKWLGSQRSESANADSNRVLDLMARELSGGASAPTVRFLHLFSTHAPAGIDADCEPVPSPDWTRHSAFQQARCALGKVSAFLASLKDSGLYDQTAIVVLADHGAGLSVEPAMDAGWGRKNWGLLASPLLVVKPFNSRGALAVSQRVVGIRDVGATICALTRNCSMRAGRDIFGPAAGLTAYRFDAYEWRHEYWQLPVVPVEDRFDVIGPPRLAGSWLRLTHLPQEPIGVLDLTASDPRDAYGFGWSVFEQFEGRTLRWTLGTEADIYVNLQAGRDYRLWFEAMTHAGNEGQVADVELNGTRIGNVPIAVAWSRSELLLPERLIKEGANRVVFKFHKSSRPSEEDRRSLAALFDRIGLD